MEKSDIGRLWLGVAVLSQQQQNPFVQAIDVEPMTLFEPQIDFGVPTSSLSAPTSNYTLLTYFGNVPSLFFFDHSWLEQSPWIASCWLTSVLLPEKCLKTVIILSIHSHINGHHFLAQTKQRLSDFFEIAQAGGIRGFFF